MNTTMTKPKPIIHLYIEKLNRKSGEMLLDFLDLHEFTAFLNARNIEKEKSDSIPSLIMVQVKNIPPGIKMCEVGMLTVSLTKLLNICSEYENRINATFSTVSTSPFLCFITNQTKFLSLLKAPDTKISQRTPKYYKITMDNVLEVANQKLSKELERIIDGDLQVVICDVGQGSASAILSCKGGIIYDLGSNAFRSNDQVYLGKKLTKIKRVFNGIKEKALILSHWDCDHYNLLNCIDDDDLKSLKLVLFSTEAFGVYAGRVYARIQANCKNRYWAIAPANKKKGNKNSGIELFLTSPKLKLFRGENSTSKNLCGLLLTIKGNKGIVMVGGDHSNYQTWELMYHQIGVTNEVVNAVIPHHGSAKGTKLKLPQISKYGVVVVSAGNGNRYNHPNLNIVKKYINAGFTVKCTEQGPQTNTKIGKLLINQKDISISL